MVESFIGGFIPDGSFKHFRFRLQRIPWDIWNHLGPTGFSTTDARVLLVLRSSGEEQKARWLRLRNFLIFRVISKWA
jgi:hypothetical protein